jgi:hypothetical protein
VVRLQCRSNPRKSMDCVSHAFDESRCWQHTCTHTCTHTRTHTFILSLTCACLSTIHHHHHQQQPSQMPSPRTMAPALIQQRETQRVFLQQLVDGTQIPDVPIPTCIAATLRRYQRDGVNWLQVTLYISNDQRPCARAGGFGVCSGVVVVVDVVAIL